MKVALVHDWLTGMRGGEWCLQNFLTMYPQADIFTLLHSPGTTTTEIDQRVKQTSFLQKLPFAKKLYRHYLPLYPFAIRSLDLSSYDLVISLSHAAAKNVKVSQDAIHFSYCFTPMRYIWDQAYSYFGKLTPLLWPVIKMLRWWDTRGAQSVDCLIGISQFVCARIKCFYSRESEVLCPPVDSSWIKPLTQYQKGTAFLCAGGLVPYKRIDLVVEAFRGLEHELWIVGTGPEEKRLKELAPKNVKFFGKVKDQELAGFYRDCRALIFPGKEDFGMIPVECMASGRPVIGRYDGALKETVAGIRPWIDSQDALKGSTGVFFQPQASVKKEISALRSALSYFIKHEDAFTPSVCIERAQQFSVSEFYRGWCAILHKFGVSCDSVPVLEEQRVDEQRKELNKGAQVA